MPINDSAGGQRKSGAGSERIFGGNTLLPESLRPSACSIGVFFLPKIFSDTPSSHTRHLRGHPGGSHLWFHLHPCSATRGCLRSYLCIYPDHTRRPVRSRQLFQGGPCCPTTSRPYLVVCQSSSKVHTISLR